MSEETLTITTEDVQEANQLSLSCPICANPVEKNATHDELRPVVCTRCGTLYHRICWEQNGGKCAILGCGNEESRPYGTQGHVLKIEEDDIPSDEEVRRMELRRLKQLERAGRAQRDRVEKPQSFWQQLFAAIRRAFFGR